MTAVRRSLAYSMADSYLSVVLQLIGTMVIARLLTPPEVGIYAVAAVFAALASTFRDFGVAEYLIQEKELTTDKIRAALTVNIAVSWLIGLSLYIFSGPISDFYRSPGIAEVIQIQALNLFFIPFGAVTLANFRRQLDFRPIFLANLVGNITNFVVATTCALSGLGYMSLAWASLASNLTTVALAVVFRPANFPWLPGIKGIASVLRFGKHASGIYVFGQAGKSAPEMVIGRVLDMPSVAFFSRAGGLIEIFHRIVLRAIHPICLPYFSKSNREQGSVVAGYLKATSYLVTIGWTFFIFLGVAAYGAVRLIYGEQWAYSVPLAQILCAAALMECTFLLSKEVLIAAGRVERSNILQFGIQSTKIAGLFAVIPFGLYGACWGLFAASTIGALLSQRILYITIGLTLRDTLSAWLPGALVSLISTAPVIVWAIISPADESNYIAFLGIGGAITGVLWLLAVRKLMPSLWGEITLITKRFRP